MPPFNVTYVASREMIGKREVPTVFVVEDDSVARMGLVALLQMKGYRAPAYASAEEFLEKERETPVACLVLDVLLPGLDGFELQSVIAQRGDFLPIIFISAKGDVPMAVRAIKSGAVGFLTKPVNERQLLADVEQALALSQKEFLLRAEIREIQERYGKLTAREAEVLTFVTSGRLNKQTAAELGIVENTVKVHRRRIMKKMRVGSVAELVLLTQKIGLLQKPAVAIVSTFLHDGALR